MATYSESMSKGMKLSGKSRITMINSSRTCFCSPPDVDYEEVMSGGVSLSGSADVWDNKIRGGIYAGGTARVSVATQPWDEYVMVLPLDETSGTVYYDHTTRHLDGTGTATPDIGPFCSGSQHFDGLTEYITLPYDNYHGPFTATAWIKIEDIFSARMWYSRGHTTLTDKWYFTQGHSFINHLAGRVQNTDSTAMEAYSTTTMDAGEWYHVATSYDGSSFSQHIDGIDEGSWDSTGSPVTGTNGGYIARYEGGQPYAGNVQELRLYGGILSTAWLKAEYDNWCNPEFYHVSKKMLPTW